MRSFEVVFFDLDHTLIDTRMQYRLGLREAADILYGAGRTPDAWSARFLFHNDQLWPLYDRREISMLDLRRQRFLRTWKDFGVNRTEGEADEFHRIYSQTFGHTLFPYDGTHVLLETLRRRYRLGIITNGSPDLQWSKMVATGLNRFFTPESTIISAIVGKAKPHPSVFQAACDALSVNSDSAIMVGDNYRSDVLGARQFGLQAIWYIPDPSMQNEAMRQGLSEDFVRSPDRLVEMLQSFPSPR